MNEMIKALYQQLGVTSSKYPVTEIDLDDLLTDNPGLIRRATDEEM